MMWSTCASSKLKEMSLASTGSSKHRARHSFSLQTSPSLALPFSPLFPFLNLQANHKNRWPARTGPQSRRLRFPPWTSVLDISDPHSSHAEHKTVTQHSRFPHANHQNRASTTQRASEHIVSPPLHRLRRATWPNINASRTRRRLASFGSER
jgi:hypothetical protein